MSRLYYWLVAECQGRVIGSLVYAVDLFYRNSKAFGAVVSQEFRKHDLAFTMMKLVLDDITQTKDLVDIVYATTRTANHAPQKLTESLGFWIHMSAARTFTVVGNAPTSTSIASLTVRLVDFHRLSGFRPVPTGLSCRTSAYAVGCPGQRRGSRPAVRPRVPDSGTVLMRATCES